MVAEGHSDGIPFIVMERLENTLTNKLYGKKVKIPWPTAFDFAKQLAATFDYLHRSAVPGHSVIHRDLKVGRSGAHGRGGAGGGWGEGGSCGSRVERPGSGCAGCGTRETRGAGHGVQDAGCGVRAAHHHSSATLHSPPAIRHPPHLPTTTVTTQPDNIMFRPMASVERSSGASADAAGGGGERPSGTKYTKSDGSWSKKTETGSRSGLFPKEELVLVDFGLVSVVSGGG